MRSDPSTRDLPAVCAIENCPSKPTDWARVQLSSAAVPIIPLCGRHVSILTLDGARSGDGNS